MTYEGWTNYETWVTKLWLDNSESGQALQKEWLAEAKNQTKDRQTCIRLEEIIKEYIEENSPITDASIYSDLLTSAISRINFTEIAETIIEDEGQPPPAEAGGL